MQKAERKTQMYGNRSTSNISKINLLFKRMQSYTMIKSYQQILRLLSPHICILMNNVQLNAILNPSGCHNIPIGKLSDECMRRNNTVHKKDNLFKFNYGTCSLYILSIPHAIQNISSIELIAKSLTFSNDDLSFQRNQLMKSNWRHIMHLDIKIGLSLYDISVGEWGSSSVVAIVWTKSLELLEVWLQINKVELIYSLCQRPLKYPLDDIDPKYGLHSYTVAICIRSQDEVLWEHEFHDVEYHILPRSPTISSISKKKQTNGRALAELFPDSRQSSYIKLTTTLNGITYTFPNCAIVDCIVWDVNCTPVWSFTRVLSAIPVDKKNNIYDRFDMSVSQMENSFTYYDMSYNDAEVTGNSLWIIYRQDMNFENNKNRAKSTSIQQINLQFALAFIDQKFETKYSL